MSDSKRTGILVAAAIWLLIAGALAAAYKYFIHPTARDALMNATGSESQYKHEVTLAADGFTGYAVLRSEAMAADLKRQGVRLVVQDDKADYVGRIEALKKGDVQMAVFTVDALIAAGAAIDAFPATIVMVIDETVGADAIVAHKDGPASLQALDHPETRIVATPSSPSEFLARTVIATLSLPRLPERWLAPADGAAAAFKRFKTASPEERTHTAYVLWEPYVTKASQEQGARVLLDSSKMRGYIVDVLVAGRRFVQERPEIVRAVVESYARAAYSYSAQPDGMLSLVMQDAKAAGEPLSKVEAQSVVQGIRWKNMLENYAHFGVEQDRQEGLDTLEEIIPRIADVLVRTGALPSDPVSGRAHTLFYRGTLEELHKANFHPAKKVDILEGIGAGTADLAAVRNAAPLPALSDAEWKKLSTVGAMRVEPVAFRRGTAEVSELSQSELQALAKRFESWPSYYMRVVGHARNAGDASANQRLAQARAEAARDFLVQAGVATHRLKIDVAEPGEDGGASVSFVLGHMPY